MKWSHPLLSGFLPSVEPFPTKSWTLSCLCPSDPMITWALSSQHVVPMHHAGMSPAERETREKYGQAQSREPQPTLPNPHPEQGDTMLTTHGPWGPWLGAGLRVKMQTWLPAPITMTFSSCYRSLSSLQSVQRKT